MPNVKSELKIIEKEVLPGETSTYQTDDGTIFYWKWSSPMRLYVKSKEKEFDADSPIGDYSQILGVKGNAVFLESNGKIYKAVFTVSHGITVSYVRDLLENERLYYRALCSIERDGKQYVYMEDDPIRDAILVDASLEDLKKLQLRGIHRGNAIYYCKSEDNNPVVKRMGTNVVVISINNCLYLHAKDNFLYFNSWYKSSFYVLNMENLKILPPLQFDGIEGIYYILSVRDGVITVKGTSGNDHLLFKARLPEEYICPLSQYETRNTQLEQLNKGLRDEIEKKNEGIERKNERIRELEIGSLETVKRSLKFNDLEKLSKPLISIQLENGKLFYFDNAKPFELFTVVKEIRVNANLKLLEGEYDCSFRGTMNGHAYFSATRGKVIKFLKATLNEGQIEMEQVNEMKICDLSLFKNEPLYFIEDTKEWFVYRYNENYNDTNGEIFDVSEIRLLNKYEAHYHRGIMYLFRETSTAKLQRVNEKVVRVEGLLLDRVYSSIYSPSHSDCIYIFNSSENVLIILNTLELSLSQQCYESPSDSTNHSIVGIHEGVLTMSFDGIWGRHLLTSNLK